jgi:hypothetical protein
MLKCQRHPRPAHPSRYGKLRRGRAATAVHHRGRGNAARCHQRPDIAETLHGSFERMLAKYREAQSTLPELAPKPKPKRDYRRRKRG